MVISISSKQTYCYSYGYTKESLLKGKAQYSWPPAVTSTKFRSTASDTANIIYFLYKTSYLNEEVNRT